MRDSSSSAERGARQTFAAARRMSEAEVLNTWRQLSQGQWVVLDCIDDGHGRRFILARFQRSGERPWHRLSARERMVVAAVAAGRSNREIAETLGISVSSVAGYLRAARRKLGGPRRVDLVREWSSSDERCTTQ